MPKYQLPPLSSETEFEDLTKDLCAVHYDLSNFQLYWRKWQSQYGIDGLASNWEKELIVCQSKKKDIVNGDDKSLLKALLEEIESDVKQAHDFFVVQEGFVIKDFIFASTYKRNTNVQNKAMELSIKYKFQVIFWWWDDISDKIESNAHIFIKYYPKLSSTTKALTPLPSRNDFFIGREEELRKIEQILCDNKILLLLNGIWWIGKSKLAIEYLYKNKEVYSNVCYIDYGTDIKLSIVLALEPSFWLNWDTIEKKFNELLLKLNQLTGRNLLVIDDLKNPDELKVISKLSANFDILITSRHDLDIKNKILINTLSPADAKTLFLEYYPTNDNFDKLLTYLDYHTLFIELTAKILKSSNTLTTDKLISKFENWEFGAIRKDSATNYNNLLNNLFNINNLTPGELHTMRLLSLLPAIDISFQLLCKYLFTNDTEEFDLILISLVEKWWLIKSKNGFKIHQIIKEYFLLNHKFNLQEVLPQLSNIIQYTREKEKTAPLDLSNDIVYIESVYHALKENNWTEMDAFLNSLIRSYNYLNQREKVALYTGILEKKISNLLRENKKLSRDAILMCNNLAMSFSVWWPYEKSLWYIEIVLEQALPLLKKDELSVVYSNAGVIYEHLWKYELAESYVRKALDKTDNKITQFNLYDTLSMIQLENWNINNALLNSKKALALSEKIYKGKHPELWKIYNNIALIYKNLGEFNLALDFIHKSIDIRSGFYEWEYTVLAQSYLNLCVILFEIGSLNEALEYGEKARKILEKAHWENSHFDLWCIYKHLSIIYCELWNIDLAIELSTKSLKNMTEVFPSWSPKINDCKDLATYLQNKRNPLFMKNFDWSFSWKNPPTAF